MCITVSFCWNWLFSFTHNHAIDYAYFGARATLNFFGCIRWFVVNTTEERRYIKAKKQDF
jgi:hypothetical protein